MPKSLQDSLDRYYGGFPEVDNTQYDGRGQLKHQPSQGDGRYRGPLPSPEFRAAVVAVRQEVNASIELRLGDMSPAELQKVRRKLGYTEGNPSDDSYWS